MGQLIVYALENYLFTNLLSKRGTITPNPWPQILKSNSLTNLLVTFNNFFTQSYETSICENSKLIFKIFYLFCYLSTWTTKVIHDQQKGPLLISGKNAINTYKGCINTKGADNKLCRLG